MNRAWLGFALIGLDLLALTPTQLLDDEHALTEPKMPRYRLLRFAVLSTSRIPGSTPK